MVPCRKAMTASKIFRREGAGSKRSQHAVDGASVWLQYLPTLLCFCLFALHALLFRAWLIDDAGISFAYARNLIRGHGLVAQPGAVPVEGYSNPLWVFLLSPLFVRPPLDPTFALKLISMGLMLGTFGVVARIGRLFFSSPWWSAAATSAVLLALSVNTSFVVWTMSGLENPLYVFLCALYGLLSIEYAKASARQLVPIALCAGVCAAGLALTRPDGVVFLAAFPCVMAIRRCNKRAGWRAEIRRCIFFLGAALLPLAAYVLFRVLYFGDFYPNTYHAKGDPFPGDMRGMLLLMATGMVKTFHLFEGMFAGRAIPMMIMVFVSVSYVVFRRREQSLTLYLVPNLACSWMIYCLLPQDWMGEFRFGTLFYFTLTLTMFAMLAEALNAGSLAASRGRAVFVGIVAAFFAHSIAVYSPRSLQFAERPTMPFDAVAQHLGIRFNVYATELGISDASFLVPDLGAVLYFSRHEVIDLAGLCDRTIAQLHREEDPDAMRDHILALRPTFIRVHNVWSVRSGLFDDDRFRESYAAIHESVCPWAKSSGHVGVYSGDYVRVDAVPDLQRLTQLRESGLRRILTQPVDAEEARPFPRS